MMNWKGCGGLTIPVSLWFFGLRCHIFLLVATRFQRNTPPPPSRFFRNAGNQGYKTIHCYNPEEQNSHLNHPGNLKSRVLVSLNLKLESCNGLKWHDVNTGLHENSSITSNVI